VAARHGAATSGGPATRSARCRSSSSRTSSLGRSAPRSPRWSSRSAAEPDRVQHRRGRRVRRVPAEVGHRHRGPPRPGTGSADRAVRGERRQAVRRRGATPVRRLQPLRHGATSRWAQDVAAHIARLSRVPITYFLSTSPTSRRRAGAARLGPGAEVPAPREGLRAALRGRDAAGVASRWATRARTPRTSRSSGPTWRPARWRRSADAAVKLTQGDNPVITPQTAQEKYLGMSQTERDRDDAWRATGPTNPETGVSMTEEPARRRRPPQRRPASSRNAQAEADRNGRVLEAEGARAGGAGQGQRRSSDEAPAVRGSRQDRGAEAHRARRGRREAGCGDRGARLRLEVAAEKGLTPAQAKRLVGSTREELEADAANCSTRSSRPPIKQTEAVASSLDLGTRRRYAGGWLTRQASSRLAAIPHQAPLVAGT
jgi:hypothetical protein